MFRPVQNIMNFSFSLFLLSQFGIKKNVMAENRPSITHLLTAEGS